MLCEFETLAARRIDDLPIVQARKARNDDFAGKVKQTTKLESPLQILTPGEAKRGEARHRCEQRSYEKQAMVDKQTGEEIL